jgi:hypothetical protein
MGPGGCRRKSWPCPGPFLPTIFSSSIQCSMFVGRVRRLGQQWGAGSWGWGGRRAGSASRPHGGKRAARRMGSNVAQQRVQPGRSHTSRRPGSPCAGGAAAACGIGAAGGAGWGAVHRGRTAPRTVACGACGGWGRGGGGRSLVGGGVWGPDVGSTKVDESWQLALEAVGTKMMMEWWWN